MKNRDDKDMRIKEYIDEHPDLVPDGVDTGEFCFECCRNIGYAIDIIPYNDEEYDRKVIELCVSMAAYDFNMRYGQNQEYGYFEYSNF